MAVDLPTIEQKLAELRSQWKARPDKRKVIELQARALLRAKEILLAKETGEETLERSYQEAKVIFKD